MNEIRKKRMEAAILRSTAELIINGKLKDERIGLVSVSNVKLAKDLSTVSVYVSPFGGEKENIATLKALRENAGKIQSVVSRSLHLRVTPTFRFHIDETIKKGDEVLNLI